ncbi:MAG: hypothetical protein AB1425_11265 [Actinomycetota bacterium]
METSTGYRFAAARGRLLSLGALWGLALAAPAALVMVRPFEVSGFLVAGVLSAALGGCAGAFVAGRRAARRRGFSGGLVTGLQWGLVGGAVAAALIWTLMSFTLSGFSPAKPSTLPDLMSPRILLGGFFVSLSVFLYALAGGLLLGPVFGVLVNRAARGDKR